MSTAVGYFEALFLFLFYSFSIPFGYTVKPRDPCSSMLIVLRSDHLNSLKVGLLNVNLPVFICIQSRQTANHVSC